MSDGKDKIEATDHTPDQMQDKTWVYIRILAAVGKYMYKYSTLQPCYL